MVNKAVKKIIFGEDVRKKILSGVEITARAVGTTLGSKGRNVLLEKNWGAPIIIHDGVTVARDIVLEDPFENAAAQSVISAAQNTNNQAGDGTTTATILTYSIVREALKIVSAGINPMTIRRGINKVIPAIIDELHKNARKIETFEEMKQIATISAADAEMGHIIASAIQKVGSHGVVNVQEGQGLTIEVEYKEGMDLGKGWVSPYLINRPERMETVFEAEGKKGNVEYPFVITVNAKLDNKKLIKIANTILEFNPYAKFLIIADDFENDAVSSMVISRVKSNMNVVAIKAPEYGEHRTNVLHDVAILTGGSVIGGPTGVAYESLTIKDFGMAEKIIVTERETLIIGGRGDKRSIDDRIAALKKMKSESKDPGIIDKFESRLSKLVGGVAIISVGAPSEEEMREKKERVFDAVNATRAAIQEGIVPGGGVALLRASRIINSLELTDSEAVGAKIIKRAIQYPAQKLIENAGHENVGQVIGKILEHKNTNWGYNVETEEFEDLIKAGVIDPVKVTRSALQNAASIATMLITTEVMVINKPIEEKKDEEIPGVGRW